MHQFPSAAPESVIIHDKEFRVYLSSQQIQRRVAELGRQLAAGLPPKPLFVGVLKGSIMFMADLVRAIGLPCELDFMKISSYNGGTESSGQITFQLDLTTDITGRHVVIVEDIIDSGLSMTRLLGHLRSRNPASVTVVTLLHKAEATRYDLDLPYVGFVIPNEFVVGYGLDYAEEERNLAQIYTLDHNES